jgi:hypothetical protein
VYEAVWRNLERLALLEAGEPVRQVKHGEHVRQLILALSQMSPAFVVHRDEYGIWEGCGSFQRILAAHRHVETAARLGRASEQYDDLG